MKNSYVSDLRQEFRGYNGAKFAKDLMAGVTVAAVALPLALAFGVSSGATAASGLLTAVICGFVISLLGGAYYQVSGPTGATAASLIIPMDIQRVGEIPSSLLLPERFTLEGLDLAMVRGLLAPAVSIAALGMIESLLCGASAARMTGVRLNSDRELIAQGVGNILSPLFGGIPATAAIARTSVAIKSGAQTRLTGMIHALVLLVSLLVLGPVMAQIPLSALAGVLLVTAWRMNEWHTIRYIFSHKFKGGHGEIPGHHDCHHCV